MIDNKSWLSNASKFEKIFWGCILFFLFLFILLHFFASREFYQNKEKNKNAPLSARTILKEIEVVIDSNKMKKNIQSNETVKIISDDLHKKMKDINQTINKETKEIFKTVHNNIDKFLDFHYSVIGEYIELGSMATGKIEEHIQEELFGKNFSLQMDTMLETIAKQHQNNLKSHLDIMHIQASKGIDPSLNKEAIERLQQDVNQHFLIQQGKLGTLIIATLAAKVTKVVATKLAAKQAGVIATKAGAKAGMKSTAALTGASAGIFCGPFVWICSPIAAATLWFGTDAIIVSVDEHFNRDSFKLEIIDALKEQEQKLTIQLQIYYTKSLKEFSQKAQEKYINTPTKEKKRMTIKELITEESAKDRKQLELF